MFSTCPPHRPILHVIPSSALHLCSCQTVFFFCGQDLLSKMSLIQMNFGSSEGNLYCLVEKISPFSKMSFSFLLFSGLMKLSADEVTELTVFSPSHLLQGFPSDHSYLHILSLSPPVWLLLLLLLLLAPFLLGLLPLIVWPSMSLHVLFHTGKV